MQQAIRGKPYVIPPGIVLACILLAWCPCALALDPALDVSQYAHTAWKIRDGFPKGEISAIAQTPDGYLWLGTEFGLLRFDGVRAVPWQPPAGQDLPSNAIRSLLVSRDGTLWIGTLKGLAGWKGGKLTRYPELDGQQITRLLEDREGSIWAGAIAVTTGRLCAIHKGSVLCYGEDGSLGGGVYGLYEDGKGNIWVGVANGLWRWKAGPPMFYPLPGELNGIRGLCEDDDGALLIGWHGGIQRFVDGKPEAYPLLGSVRQFQANRLLRDRDGGLWIATREVGLVHLHNGRTDVFGLSDGLSGDYVATLFEDREGNIWVATPNGLDRFREFAIPTISVKQGLSSEQVNSVLAGKDGSVWFGASAGLNRWDNGQITAPGTGNGKRDGKLNGFSPNSLFQDSRGRIWVSTHRGVGYVENGRFVSVSGVPGGAVRSIAEDAAGNLWIANLSLGLFRLSPRSEVQQIPWARLRRKDFADALAADPMHGGLWLGFFEGDIAYFTDGQVRTSYAAADGLGDGRVNGLRFDQDGTLWAATEGGLSRLKNGRIATLTSKNGLPCNSVHWILEDDDHATWLFMSCGLVRIAWRELDTWAAAADKNEDTKHAIQTTVFDSSDGVRIRALPGGYKPLATKSTDGKLWFGGLDGVSVVDPRHLPFNKLPPPVHIEQITADRKTYDASSDANGRLQLPPLIRDLEIDYTALSLVAPEKVLFRYELEGWDRDWQDAGNRRQAFYSSLPPRNYRFRVMACNNSGVWNESGTFLDFSIAPAYYQTTWFRLSCVAGFLVLLGSLYQLRLRQVAGQVRGRMEERLEERERIARDLHDTLLQSVQGLILKFHAGVTQIPRDEPARESLEKALDRADQVLAEGRDRIRNLRGSRESISDLPAALNRIAAETQKGRQTTFKTVVEGNVRDLHPVVLEESYSIGREALVNALTHSHGRHVEVEITYDSHQFRLRVRDDGRGIDSRILEEGGRSDHWGLQGMRERARKIGAQLELWSGPGTGTEVELRVPAATAYRGFGDRSKRFRFRRSAGIH